MEGIWQRPKQAPLSHLDFTSSDWTSWVFEHIGLCPAFKNHLSLFLRAFSFTPLWGDLVEMGHHIYPDWAWIPRAWTNISHLIMMNINQMETYVIWKQIGFNIQKCFSCWYKWQDFSKAVYNCQKGSKLCSHPKKCYINRWTFFGFVLWCFVLFL